ncbi:MULTISPECIES: DedA family protein [Peribacillus]|uniref:Inner membrane protein YqjA n=1 Tax=Peribacillus simplex TaxID=1478 RepID=A0A9W4KU37_9BACI|nr:DedA family protein [Peribacillus simplex]MDR4925158.1 DedA family protein [Peribacillus simplex]WHX90152.1 DedA family protein [Peribacillus simplex]CAH0149526.1 Inner membrane protein YqjA [Peribacillus simplex]
MDIVKDLISNYGYFAIYGLLAMGIIGLPVPDEFLMTFVGYLSSISVLNVQGAFLVSFLGSISGMLISYFIGKKVGKPFLRKHGKWIKMTPARLERLEKWFNKYGPWTIIIAYFIPGVRHFASYISGMNGMGKRKYFIFAGAGAFSWCLVFTAFGYFIGVLT